jgi:hypothetical protein
LLLYKRRISTDSVPIAPSRLAANSQDRGFLAPEFEVQNLTFPAATALVPQPEASRIGIGRDWYKLSGNFPTGTSFTWGINLKALNVTETVAQGAQLVGSPIYRATWPEVGGELDPLELKLIVIDAVSLSTMTFTVRALRRLHMFDSTGSRWETRQAVPDS